MSNSTTKQDRNPNSRRQITAVRLTEAVCADHAGDGVPVATPYEGICYVCAITHNEPVRG